MKPHTHSTIQHFTAIILASSFPVAFTQSPVNDPGFSDGDNTTHVQRHTWLQRNWQLLLIVVATLLVVILLSWYIVRSVKDMRRRLALANEQETRAMKGYDQPPFQQSPIMSKDQQQPDSPPPEYTHRY